MFNVFKLKRKDQLSTDRTQRLNTRRRTFYLPIVQSQCRAKVWQKRTPYLPNTCLP